MMIERTQSERNKKEVHSARTGLWIALVALSYPFFLFVLERVWDTPEAKDLSNRAQAWLTLMIFPVILSCALALVLSLRDRGWRRPTTIVCSLLAAIFNLLTFVAISISY